jgi:hypothetical protein
MNPEDIRRMVAGWKAVEELKREERRKAEPELRRWQVESEPQEEGEWRPKGSQEPSPGLSAAMPWERDGRLGRGLKGRKNFSPSLLAPLQGAFVWYGYLPQGIGLRPQPWASICRPFGPVLLTELTVYKPWQSGQTKRPAAKAKLSSILPVSLLARL